VCYIYLKFKEAAPIDDTVIINPSKAAVAIRKLLRIGKDVKSNWARVKDFTEKGLDGHDWDVRIQLIQELIPVGLERVQEVWEEEDRQFAGKGIVVVGAGSRDRFIWVRGSSSAFSLGE
jgi:hypothetical protein